MAVLMPDGKAADFNCFLIPQASIVIDDSIKVTSNVSFDKADIARKFTANW